VENDLPSQPSSESSSASEPSHEIAPAPPAPVAADLPVTPAAVNLPAVLPPIDLPLTPTVVAPPIPVAPTYRDRSAGLMIFGVFQIILGLMSALMVPFAALGMFMSRLAPGGGMRPGQFVSGVSIYAFIAVAFVCLGIGSIQTKRWARALTLVISVYWLLSGVLITVMLTAVLPVTMRRVLQMQQNATQNPSPEMSTGVMAVVLTMIIVFAAFFLIVVPIAYVVFYSRKDVAETCRHRDPVERWTDRTPLPVLGASVILAIQAVYMLVIGLSTPLFPLFGRYLYGISGLGCFLLVAILDAYIAVALFRLKSVGWWIAALTIPIRLLSMVITYARADMMQAYSRMGMTDQQLQMLNSSPLIRSHVFLWWGLLSTVILYGYILWLKRYFKASAGGTQPAQTLLADAS
jgi:hypothetical protein